MKNSHENFLNSIGKFCNLFEPEILLLFFGIDKPSIKIELIPESSVPTYFVEIILNA